MTTLRRVLLALVLALGFGAPLGAAAQSADVNRLVIGALEQDAAWWQFNQLDRGSYGRVVEQAGYTAPEHVYRMSYTYNGGVAGWTEVFLYDETVISIRFHDNTAWRAVRAPMASTPAPAAPAATARRWTDKELAVWALEEDSGSWEWNRLDLGSYGALQQQPGYDPGHHVFRMAYTYNGGREGWTEVYILDGEVLSIRYHDNTAWASVRTSQTRNAARANEREACRQQARADGLDAFAQCGW